MDKMVRKEIFTALLIIVVTTSAGLFLSYIAGYVAGTDARIAMDACAGCLNMVAGLGG